MVVSEFVSRIAPKPAFALVPRAWSDDSVLLPASITSRSGDGRLTIVERTVNAQLLIAADCRATCVKAQQT